MNLKDKNYYIIKKAKQLSLLCFLYKKKIVIFLYFLSKQALFHKIIYYYLNFHEYPQFWHIAYFLVLLPFFVNNGISIIRNKVQRHNIIHTIEANIPRFFCSATNWKVILLLLHLGQIIAYLLIESLLNILVGAVLKLSPLTSLTISHIHPTKSKPHVKK